MGLFNESIPLLPLQQQQFASIVYALRPTIQQGKAVSFGDCRYTDPDVLRAVIREAQTDGLAVTFTDDRSVMTVSPAQPVAGPAPAPLLVQLVDPFVVAVPMTNDEPPPEPVDPPRRRIGF